MILGWSVGDQAVGNKARQETGQQISESKSRKPADEALSDVKKMEDSSEQPDFTNDLLEKSGTYLMSQPYLAAN